MKNTQSTNDISIDDMLNPNPVNPIVVAPVAPVEPVEPIVPATPTAPVAPVAPVDKENKPDLKTLLASFTNDVEDEVNKTLKADLLLEYKGTNFDAEGNIVDAEGKVLKSAEDIAKDLGNENIVLDAEGNQVDADGKIIKTKDALEKEKQNSLPFVNEILEDLEFELLDENGEPKVYTDDKEGVKALANDYAIALLQDFKQNFFAQNAELAEVAKHILAGGKVEDFRKAVDYSKLIVSEMTDGQLIEYIKDSYKLSGFSQARITDMIQLFKDGNKLKEEGKYAIEALKENEKNLKADRDQKYIDSIIAQKAEQEAYWETIKSTINKGDLGIANIPKKDQEGFYDYMSNAVDRNGNSKEMLDRKQETIEQKLALAYFRYKGFDLNQLVTNKANTMKAKTLRERMNEAAKINYSSSTHVGKTSSKTANASDVSIDEMLS